MSFILQSINRLIGSKYFMLLVIMVALILRLINLDQSLWLDEAIGALAARDLSVGEILNSFAKVDNHPPLYYLLLKFWTSISGYSEVALRFPSVVFAILTIYLVYKIESYISADRNWALAIAFLLATSQIHVYYSQEARMYSMSIFLVSLSSYFFIKTLKNGSLGSWIGFSLSNALLIMTDYLPVLMFFTFLVYASVSVREKKWWLLFFISFFPSILFFGFWVPNFLHQLGGGRWLLETVPSWARVSGGVSIKQIALLWMKYVLGRITLQVKLLYYFLVFICSLPFIVVFGKAMVGKITKNYYLYWFTIPLVLSLLLSFVIPVFNYFRMVFILPGFYGLLVSGLKEFKNKRNVVVFLLGFILINLLSLGIYYFDRTNHREDWKSAVHFIERSAKADEVVIFSYPEPFAPYRWYATNNFSFGGADSILATGESLSITRELVSSKGGVFYFEYLSSLSDPNGYVRKTIEEDFTLDQIYNFNGVGFIYHFVR
jgi:uncharacterized membrane protein